MSNKAPFTCFDVKEQPEQITRRSLNPIPQPLRTDRAPQVTTRRTTRSWHWKTALFAMTLLLFGSVQAQVLFDEQFTGGVSATGFTINVINGTTSWYYNDPGGKYGAWFTGGGFDADFAICDSQFGGTMQTSLDAELISPVFDASSGTITLQFDQDLNDQDGASYASVRVYNGSVWTEVLDEEFTTVEPPATSTIDITAAAGGSPTAQVKFYYLCYGPQYYWALDNISVTACGTVGISCDDGDANTVNDVYDAQCNCVGLPFDCEGVAGGPATVGTSCDDGDANTQNDVYGADCVCAGALPPDFSVSCPNGAGGCDNMGTVCPYYRVFIATLGVEAINGFNEPITVSLSGAPSWLSYFNAYSYSFEPPYPDALNHLFANVAAGFVPGTYTYDIVLTSVPSGITHSFTTTTTFTAPVPPTCGGPYGPLSATDNPIALNGFPSNGIWFGTGVNLDTFDPAAAGTGTHTLTYHGRSGVCYASCSTEITVNAPPPPDCEGVPGGPAAVGTPCNDGDANTQNDVYGTDCVCAGAPAPDFSVSCVYGAGGCDEMGRACTNMPFPIATLGVEAINGFNEPITGSLSGAPSWLSYNNVISDPLEPPYPDAFNHLYANVAAGFVPGTYTYDIVLTSVPSGITHSFTTTTTFMAPVPVTCGGPYGPFSATDGPITLNASTFGSWQGDGITGNHFDPAAAGVGDHTLTFAADDPDACQASCTTTITVSAPLPPDCEGVPGGTATVGTPCDDGDASTGNDIYDANCNCVGQALDCAGTPGGTATVGTYCDDGDVYSQNDVYGTDCVCAGALPCTTPVFPLDGGTTSAFPVVLSWNAVAGATGYDVYVDNYQAPMTLISSNQSGTSISINPMLENVVYPDILINWKVVPHFGAEAAVGCATSSFRILPPDCPDLLTPADAAANVDTAGTTLSWSVSPNTNFYTVFLSTTNPFGGFWQTVSGVNNTSISTGTLLPGQTYYWKVIAGNVYGSSDGPGGCYPAAVHSFTTEALDCEGDQVVVMVTTDSSPEELSWEITDASNAVIATGGPSPGQANMLVTDTVCLGSTPTSACYGFTLMDSFGDGISGGNWQLRSTSGMVLLGDDFANGSRSPSALPAIPSYTAHSFCLPLGNCHIASTSCGRFDYKMVNKVLCNNVPGATSYQFEFSDPDAGFIRRIAVPVNSVAFNQMVTSPLTPGVHYFVRVRSNAVPPMASAHFGGGCEVGIGVAQAVTCTELISAPNYGYSCGQERAFNTNNSFIYATPVVGATEYRFRLTIPSEGYDQTFVRSTYILQLKWNASVAPPLVNGSTYNVQVNVKVGALYSGFCGDVCTITINNNPGDAMRPEASMMQSNGTATLWPNPVRENQVNLSIDGIQDADQQITVGIQDIYGKQVFAKEYGNSGERFSTILDLPGDIASGVYMVNITVNGQKTVQRLSIIR